MKLFHKRILWLLFIGLFFILVPLVLAYGLGYRYNFDKGKFEATGILFIKTYPRQTNIYLNDKLIEIGTPLQESYLPPNHYNLKISKEGFLDWSKNITIYPHTTTFVEDVILFKRDLPKPIKNFDLQQSLALSDDRYLFLGLDKQIQSLLIFNPNYEQFNLLKTFLPEQKIKLISISNNNKKIIYQLDSQFWLLNLETPSVNYRLTGLNSLYYQDFKWDSESDNIIYARLYQSLYKIDISTSLAKIVNQYNDVEFYFPYQGKVYLCQSDPTQNKLILASTDTNFANPTKLVLLPQTSQLSLLPDNKNLIILDSDNRFLYFINSDQKDLLMDIMPNVKQAKWYPKIKDKLVVWNDNEIYVYFLDRQNSTLVDRLSGPIQNVWWHSGGTYLFYQINNEINIIELDTRDKKNNYTLVTLEPDSPLMTNSKGDKIFYYSWTDKKFYLQAIQ